MDRVADYMTEDIVSIDEARSVVDAVNVMREKSIGSIFVTKEGNISGIFTERDLLVKPDLSDPSGLEKLKISEVMTGDLKTVDKGEIYTNVIDLMQENNIRHMPVIENGSIIGVVSLRDLLNHYHKNLEHLLEETVAALSYAVEKRDPYTAGHQDRVAQLACAIAQQMGLSAKQVSGVSMAAIIHDVGKMYVPSQILNKPGKLSEAEFTLIKIHPQVGYDILKPIQFPWPIAQIVLQHHERLDGTGYPKGLVGADILLEAKIITVADVVEAIASHRPYRPSLGIDVALGEIEKHSGKFYDEQIVDLCVDLFKNGKFDFKEES
jgi:putative nucleotidyltransferase with HDIG domain